MQKVVCERECRCVCVLARARAFVCMCGCVCVGVCGKPVGEDPDVGVREWVLSKESVVKTSSHVQIWVRLTDIVWRAGFASLSIQIYHMLCLDTFNLILADDSWTLFSFLLSSFVDSHSFHSISPHLPAAAALPGLFVVSSESDSVEHDHLHNNRTHPAERSVHSVRLHGNTCVHPYMAIH